MTTEEWVRDLELVRIFVAARERDRQLWLDGARTPEERQRRMRVIEEARKADLL